jgi:hypothetical protein
MSLEALETGQSRKQWSRDPAVSGEEAAERDPDLARTSFLREGEEGEPPPGWTRNFATAAKYEQAANQITYVPRDPLLSS